METKKCFKCGRDLPLSEFYKHPKMADGHLNKCKECTKTDVKENYLKNSNDSNYMEKERERGREKYKRLGYRGKISETQKKKRELYPGLRNTKAIMKKPLSREFELHHWNYNLLKNVIVLQRSLHHRLHTIIDLNVEEGIYYHDGEPLDTIEKHLDVIKEICEEYGFDFHSVDVIQL